ncbi:MAG: carbohydrate ABC transporter permease [Catenulispora sp.]|nr:carbohydrate ABC transporter permease [Catenulispora sp.]
MKTSRRTRALLNSAAALFALIWAFPVYWMVTTAFKPQRDILTSTPHFLPFPLTLANFSDAIHKPHFGSYLVNSLIVTLTVVVIATAVGFLAALALARFRFLGRRAILVTILAIQMIPAPALVIPLFLTMKSLHLLNNLLSLGLTYTALVVPLTIWVLRGFAQGVPVELEEAARLDGCGPAQVIRHVLLPLLAPGIIATSIFAFITAWNEYIYAYVMMKDDAHYTLPVWLATFSTNTGTDYAGLIAGSTLFALPAVAFFMIAQTRLTAGMTAGAVKG